MKSKTKLKRQGSMVIRGAKTFMKRRGSEMVGENRESEALSIEGAGMNSPSVLWATESEDALIEPLEVAIFRSKSASIVFLSKCLKPDKMATRKDQVKHEIIVITKNRHSDEMFFNVILAGETKWTMKTTEPLKNLKLIDGNPKNLGGPAFEGSRLAIRFSFQSFSKPSVYVVMLTNGDKNISIYCIHALCQKFAENTLRLDNVNQLDLEMLAANVDCRRRCPIIAADIEQIEAKEGTHTELPWNVPPKSNNAQNASEAILSAEEQSLLSEVLAAENLLHVPPGELLAALGNRISELERQTGSTLRSWENHGEAAKITSSQAMSSAEIDASDPIATLVYQLDTVFNEMNDLTVWMANYDRELRVMRHDIAKIAIENERLNISSSNEKLLKEHIKDILSHYQISPAAEEIWANFQEILHTEIVNEVEFGAAPKVKGKPALSKLSSIANELQLAVQGKAHIMEHDATNQAQEFPEELYLVAVAQKIEEVNNMIEAFCGHIYYFLSFRIKTNADGFRETISLATNTNASKLPLIVSRATMHEILSAYATLINSLQQLEQDGFEKAIAVYSQDMGEAYADVLANFFSVMKNRVNTTPRSLPCQLSDISKSQIETVDEEFELTAKRAAAAYNQTDILTPSAGLRHTFSQLIPIVNEEMTFLSKAFWNIDAYDNVGTSKNDLKHLLMRTTKKQALIELDELLDQIFIKKGKIDSCMLQYFVLPVTKPPRLDEIIFMLVACENVRDLKKNSFLKKLFKHPENGLATHLESAFSKFVESQIRTVETSDPRSALNNIARVPGFVHRIIELWNVATREVLYQAHDKRFANQFIGKKLKEFLERILQWMSNFANPKSSSDQMTMQRSLLACYHILRGALPVESCSVVSEIFPRIEQSFDDCLNAVVVKILQESLNVLITFVQTIEELVSQIDAADVIYHYSKSHVSKVIQQVDSQSMERAVAEIKIAVQRAYPDNENLRCSVYARIRTSLVAYVDRFICLVQECYGETSVLITPAETKSLMRTLTVT